jgi:hypothetical protein
MKKLMTFAVALGAAMLISACNKTEQSQGSTEAAQPAADTAQGDPTKMAPGGPVVEDPAMAAPVNQQPAADQSSAPAPTGN